MDDVEIVVAELAFVGVGADFGGAEIDGFIDRAVVDGIVEIAADVIVIGGGRGIPLFLKATERWA